MYIGLTVTGLAEEITRFKQAVRGQNENGQEIIIDFSQLIPIPKEIADPFTPQLQMDDDRLSFSPSWSERNWGSSSPALFTEILEDSAGMLGGPI